MQHSLLVSWSISAHSRRTAFARSDAGTGHLIPSIHCHSTASTPSCSTSRFSTLAEVRLLTVNTRLGSNDTTIASISIRRPLPTDDSMCLGLVGKPRAVVELSVAQSRMCAPYIYNLSSPFTTDIELRHIISKTNTSSVYHTSCSLLTVPLYGIPSPIISLWHWLQRVVGPTPSLTRRRLGLS